MDYNPILGSFLFMIVPVTIRFAPLLFDFFWPLTDEEKKILKSFKIALENGSEVKISPIRYGSDWEVTILSNYILVSDRLGNILHKIYLKSMEEKRKLLHSTYVDKIYSEVIDSHIGS